MDVFFCSSNAMAEVAAVQPQQKVMASCCNKNENKEKKMTEKNGQPTISCISSSHCCLDRCVDVAPIHSLEDTQLFHNTPCPLITQSSEHNSGSNCNATLL